MAKGQFSANDLHVLRHIADYQKEIEQQVVTPARRNELKKRFDEVKGKAPAIFKQAYKLLIALDGESLHDSNNAWEERINEIHWLKKSEEFNFADDDLIHPFRHMDEYISQIEAGKISSKRRKELKKRLRIIMSYSLNAFVTAEELEKNLYQQ